MNYPIIDIGRYIRTDRTGFLISRLSEENVQKEWRPATEDFLTLILDCYGANVDSVYLRGSVASGVAIPDVSDIDFFVITKQASTSEERIDIWSKVGALVRRYPFITKFDVGFYTREEILRNKERVLIKLTSVCLYGKSVIDDIDDLKPGKDVAVTLLGLEKEISEVIKDQRSGQFIGISIEEVCVWLMKRFVRGAFELTSERSSSYTRDLFKCKEMFLKYYPDRKADIEEALWLAINPIDNTKEITRIANNFGRWIVEEGKRLGIMS